MSNRKYRDPEFQRFRGQHTPAGVLVGAVRLSHDVRGVAIAGAPLDGHDVPLFVPLDDVGALLELIREAEQDAQLGRWAFDATHEPAA